MAENEITYKNNKERILSRLEELRHVSDLTEKECRALADDTLAQYAPLAEELGLTQLQYQLQELSMMYGYPEDYGNIKNLLQEAEASCNHVFKTFKVPISAMLDSLGIEHEFKFRMKSVYSIWRKMKNDGKEFDEVYDLFATRIIYKVPEKVKPLSDTGLTAYQLSPSPLPLDDLIDPEILTCWRIYTAITSLYRVQPDRIKDWITHPKPSGYQALQMTCMGPDCNWIEIQIRSERMNYEAEYGSAAHWKYKQESHF